MATSQQDKARHRAWLAQAELFDDATRAMLDQIDIRAGARCLDVGCGPGSTMKLLGARAGVDGSVTGLDFDRSIGEAAIEWLREQDSCAYDFVEANIDDELDLGQRYDVVFGRAVLIHASDPAASLRRLWRLVKPGGWLVAQEYDFGQICVYPDEQWMARWRDVLFGVLDAVGRHPRIGRSLPELFERADLGRPHKTSVGGAMRPLPEVASALVGMCTRLLEIPLPTPLATPEEAAQLVADIERARESPPYVLMQAAVGAWQHKPLS